MPAKLRLADVHPVDCTAVYFLALIAPSRYVSLVSSHPILLLISIKAAGEVSSVQAILYRASLILPTTFSPGHQYASCINLQLDKLVYSSILVYITFFPTRV